MQSSHGERAHHGFGFRGKKPAGSSAGSDGKEAQRCSKAGAGGLERKFDSTEQYLGVGRDGQ